MPELPEVETIRRELAPALVGRRITGVRVGRPDIIGYPSVRDFARGAKGRVIRGLGRTGKYLVLELDRDRQLIIHLRLSGHLAVARSARPLRHERLRLGLENRTALVFVEPRVLGRAYLVDRRAYPPQLEGMLRMGPEPIDRGFDAGYLAGKLAGRKAAVKSLLLDQRVCCGVGNIYSDEALFRARIRPTRRAGAVKAPEAKRLAAALRGVLEDGIRWCGTTMADERYLRPGGSAGEFQTRLAVFRRDGEPCPACGSTIRRVRIGNRSSHYCPACQR